MGDERQGVTVFIHADSAIGWHNPFAQKMRDGLRAIGIAAGISCSRSRESDVAILLGTTLWRHIETTGNYLLVDRCSFNHTDEWVSLVWNGHGRRGEHLVPEHRGDRWQRIGCEVKPWSSGSRTVLCGQTETYSPSYKDLTSWYDQTVTGASHFRKHPAGDNPTGLPTIRDWDDVGLAVTLNSSVAIDAVMAGIPTVTMDGAAMAWDVTSHRCYEAIKPDRRAWLEWLAWTQWHHDEIRRGKPIKHLFERM